jgi:hypothetical protein
LWKGELIRLSIFGCETADLYVAVRTSLLHVSRYVNNSTDQACLIVIDHILVWDTMHEPYQGFHQSSVLDGFDCTHRWRLDGTVSSKGLVNPFSK